jgi:alpha,alpha-trehalase
MQRLAVRYFAHSAVRMAAGGVLIALSSLGACHQSDVPSARVPPPPEEQFGELFTAVQRARVFDDQKTFVDAVPKLEPKAIVASYDRAKGQPGFGLKRFVTEQFTLPAPPPAITPPENLGLREHIDWLWPRLTRETVVAPAYSSLIPLPRPYVVPGGRFREGYYWDTYFTMLGLQKAGHEELIDDMLRNFADEIDRFGHIPNGNRSYYLSRSQPPYFSHMVELAANAEGEGVYQTYLPQLEKEYAYWMKGVGQTAPGQASQNVVVLPDGTILNRYWDDLETPRSESYAEDVQTAEQAKPRVATEVFRELRAAAESGWDFSSRWFGDNETLASIRTTAIVPVDLNSLLYHLEQTIVKGCSIRHEQRCVRDMTARAARRAGAIEKYLWNEQGGFYGDYDWQQRKPRDNATAAMLYPLFVGLASSQRAQRTAERVKSTLLKEGGLATTTFRTGQQWDRPNGWAPLQWIAVAGLRRYRQSELAQQIGTRFLGRVKALYARSHKLVEKYAIEGSAAGEGGGGEYPLQDGFGWTNGVTAMLLDLYPNAEAN